MKTMLKPLVVINIVGLTPSLIGKHTPCLNRLIEDGFMASMDGVFPAVTCSAQASMLTGVYPDEHGIVGNGWYFRELAEVMFWNQSNNLVQGEKVWEAAHKAFPQFSCAKLFWWFNMYSSVDFSVTPRPIYPADGRKIPGLYSSPPDLQERYEKLFGKFPLFNFWGPTANIQSSQWIADCAKQEFDDHKPTLQLVYLPHLDYNLQRLGPDDDAIWDDVEAIDQVAGDLIEHVRQSGADVLVVSEYGIEKTSGYININMILREHGYIAVRETLGWELLDAGASKAFAVADHQLAHVYVNDPADIKAVSKLLLGLDGVEHVLTDEGKKAWHIDHRNAGDIVVIAQPGFWFTYYYWLDDKKAPDFARTVDIHRKPGYDPVELFLDPEISMPGVKVGYKLLRKKMGFRMLMDVIPLDPGLVQGTHGRMADSSELGPLLIGTNRSLAADRYHMTDLKDLILRHWV